MLYKLFARILVTVLAVFFVAYLIPGIDVDGFTPALIVALILGMINVTVKPLLFFLTLPITLLTFGLFAFVLNALLLWFVALLVEGFEIESFTVALLGSIVISVVMWAGHRLLNND